MRFTTAILFLLLCSAFVAGDKKPDYALNTKPSSIVSDNLANVYFVSEDKFTKYDMKLNLMKEFSNKNFGSITSADVTNPLRILLYYREFGRIVFLDNTLSQNGEPIALEKLGYPLAILAASSHDNGTWIYDQPTFELLRFDNSLAVTSRTGNLSQILAVDLQPDFLIEKDNHVFLNNPKTGIIVFDVFGTYIKTIPLLNLRSFQVADDEIIYYENGQLHAWNLKTAETTLYVDPAIPSAINMRLEKEAIFVQDTGAVQVYIRKK